MIPAGCLIDSATGRTVVEQLFVADSFWSRLAGLQFRRSLAEGAGLLLAPCQSVHTCCMRFALDIACLDTNGTVVEVRRGVRPWRIVIPWRKTFAILETSSDGLKEVEVGDRLRLSLREHTCARVS